MFAGIVSRRGWRSDLPLFALTCAGVAIVPNLPTLVLWSANSMWAKHNTLAVWRSRAEQVTGFSLDCGHFPPKEDPERTSLALFEFLS
jgi:pimeloyl-ACP methyl ester carboxylesterase